MRLTTPSPSSHSRFRRRLGIVLIVLSLILLLCHPCLASKSSTSSATEEDAAAEGSVRWRVMSGQIGTMVANGVLVLIGGSPISTLRAAMSELRTCVGKAYDETVGACIEEPGHAVAAGWLVLTDWRTWVWPPEADVIDDVVVDVLSRRLRPRVREDQCGRSDRPRRGEEEKEKGKEQEEEVVEVEDDDDGDEDEG